MEVREEGVKIGGEREREADDEDRKRRRGGWKSWIKEHCI